MFVMNLINRYCWRAHEVGKTLVTFPKNINKDSQQGFHRATSLDTCLDERTGSSIGP